MRGPRQSNEIIYGIQPVQEAVAQGRSLNKVFIQKDLHNDRLKEIIRQLVNKGIPFQMVPKEKLARLTPKMHQGIVAIGAPVEFYSVEQLLPQIYETGESPLLVILDGVTDVRNIGAIARSAECFGAHGLVVPAIGSAMINAEAVKSSSGALNTIPVCREINFMQAIRYILNSGLQLVACTEKSKTDIADADLKSPSGIIMGSEGEGIRPELLDLCAVKARIPMAGRIASLNVSVASGIVLYEACRQRMK